MEDLPERSTTPPQPEEQPAEAGAETAPQASEPRAAAPEAAEQPLEVPTADVPAPAPQAGEQTTAEPTAATSPAETEAAAPSVAETPRPPSEPAAAPARPAKPAGPRLAELRSGAVVEGKVTRIERYGAFVDLGLVERRDGLIHISELAPHRIRRVEDVVHVGDTVRARVVSVDLDRGRIALSLNDVDAGEYTPAAPSPSHEPALTSMALAFERAFGRLREERQQGESSPSRENSGDKKRREQEKLMEKLRSTGR